MKSYNLNLLWITLLMLSLHHPRIADSFQCYECENCPTIGENDKKYLKECGLPGLPEIQRPTRPVTTLNWEEEEEKEEEEEGVDEDLAHMNELEDTSTSSTTNSTPTSTVTSTSIATSPSTAISTSTVALSATLSPTASSTSPTSSSNPLFMLLSTSITNTTSTIKPTTADVTGEEDSANNRNSTEESATSEEKKKADTWSLFQWNENDQMNFKSEENLQPKKVRKPRQLPGNKPVCYVLKVKNNGFEVTNRGCGAAVADRNLTCKMLSKGQPYTECGLCEGNMCNNAPIHINGVMGTLYVLTLIALYSW